MRWTTSATRRDQGKRCYHLVDPVGYRVGDVLDIFSKAAHAPKMNLFVNAALLGFIPKSDQEGPDGAGAGAPRAQRGDEGPRRARGHDDLRQLPDTLRLPRHAGRAQGQSASRCPNLKDYAWRLWDYWERHLDPDAAHRPLAASGTVGGKVVLVTGGSSGIGLAAACTSFAEAGAITVICGRDQDKLADEACKEIRD